MKYNVKRLYIIDEFTFLINDLIAPTCYSI